MWAGMSMSGACTRYEVRPCVLMPHTIYAKIAVQVIWGSNRVENLNVVARHVEVAEREVLEVCQKAGKFEKGCSCPTVMLAICLTAKISCVSTRRGGSG